MAALIALDTQHRGKPRPDVGAVGDLDGDGVHGELGEREVDLVAEYLARLRVKLELLGYRVAQDFEGTYPERNRRADALGAQLYLAGHMNAGGGRYGLVGVDYRAPRGGLSRRLASQIARQWRAGLGIGRVQVWDRRPGDRGFVCIARCRCPALLLEPLFLDGHAHLLTPQRRGATLDGIARGLAVAISAEIPP